MKIAVVGSGVSGLAATWLLNEFSDHEVHLYEADSRPGGHANTVNFKQPGNKSGTQVDVDTGFIVFNPSTYPNFLRFLRLYPSLKSAILPTEMTFSVSRDGGEYLEKEGYSDAFRDDYLIVTGKPSWLTLHGGSQRYVKHILSSLPSSQLHLNAPVCSVSSVILPHLSPDQSHSYVDIQTAEGAARFDHVIMACHSDVALDVLRAGGGLNKQEKSILESFKWNRNEAVLHSDVKLMPKRRIAWSCWNYLTRSAIDANSGEKKANVDQVALTYWMNDLQHISEKEHGPIFVTLNPPFEPDADKVAGRYQYDHPVLDATAITAQSKMHTIQNKRGISFAGAWLNYGFHEDGFTSGLRAALALQAPDSNDIRVPFEVLDADREPQPVLVSVLFDVLEGTGMKRLLGNVLGFWLDFWLMVFLGVFALFVRLLDG
ncbi:hypothetical protein EW026_g3439 [Hermanssonia centrifuga]|uniref:Amine oxidase domain-containing protein n=1 Tax=Hermanssonia centrifuga TaxID=98765 RepID=A0A4S4KL56_9APHY|nr:hypothetical protein EW026_g3439 [Hermanssonia centrifuga]